MSSPLALARTATVAAVAKSLARYRVMAFVTGAWLLLLTVEMIAKYGFLAGDQWMGSWISYIHGWIYVVYLVTVVDLYTKLRAPWTRLARLIIAGVIPVVSFIEERRTAADVRELVGKAG